MADGDVEGLRRESGSGTVGPRLYREICDVAARVARRYPAAIYSPNRQPHWDDDAVLEVVHECVIRRMKPDHVRLLFGYANDLDALRGMIGKRIQETLRDLRVTDVIDNLCRRIRSELLSHPDVEDSAGFLIVPGTVAREPTEAELSAVARKVSLIPQMPGETVERAPRVYSPDALRSIAETILRGLPGGVRTNATDRILRQVLTHRTVVALVPEVEAGEVATRHGDPAVELEVKVAANTVLNGLSTDQRTLLQQVLEGWSDKQIAEANGYSRGTAHNRRQPVETILQAKLAGVDPELADDIVSRIYERLFYET